MFGFYLPQENRILALPPFLHKMTPGPWWHALLQLSSSAVGPLWPLIRSECKHTITHLKKTSLPTPLDQTNLILTLKFVQASCSWAALWFLCAPTRTHKQQTGVFSSMQKSLSSSRCSLHFRESGSFVTSTTVCSLKADLCWCRRAWAWHRDASQVRQVLIATDGVSMQWSQLMVENLDSLFGAAVGVSVGAILSAVLSFTLARSLVSSSSVGSEVKSTWHSGQKRGTTFESSVSHTVWMQLRQKLCPHGSVTGSVKTSWHTGHLRDSPIASILLFAPVWQQLHVFAPGLPAHECFTGLFKPAHNAHALQFQITGEELTTSGTRWNHSLSEGHTNNVRNAQERMRI